MNTKNNKFKRIVSVSAAAVCMVSALGFVPLAGEEVSAANEMTAFEITENMEIGWNIGNSLDASNGSGLSTETSWGNPKITQELISAVKAKGFNTIRVPTTWYKHLDSDNNIDAEWLARVKEVVDYAYNQDMYVILNIHHEEWINRSDFSTAYDEMSPKLVKIWQQIAAYFADYDQRLIFEGMNEPRETGTAIEWTGNAACYEVVNKLNADFVKTVRSIDSPYKDTRLLMVPSYCASGYDYVYKYLDVPDDDYIAVSLHAYSPYNFAMNPEVPQSDHDTFTGAYKADLDSLFGSMQKYFTDKDIPVVLGEFSASNYNNTEARCEWAEYYISSAKKIGIPCVLWDNNVISNPSNAGEAHGYINRSSLEWYEASEPVVDSMMKVINDDSIVWGSERKLPVYIHADIDSGTTLYKDATGQHLDNGCSDNCQVTPDMLKGADIAVKFSGDSPIIAGMDSSWGNWTELNPYDVDEENGIAYYSGDTFLAMWANADISWLCIKSVGVTTIYQISIIDKAEVQKPIVPVEKKVSGTVEELVISDYPEGENYIVIDGVKYTLLDNAVVALIKNVKVGDSVSFTGAFKADSDIIEEISDLTVTSPDDYYEMTISGIFEGMEYLPAIGAGGEAVIGGTQYILGYDAVQAFLDADFSDGSHVTFIGVMKAETDSYTIVSVKNLIVSPAGTVWGDADLSGDVEIADAVKIMCYVTDPENNPIDPQGIINGDVYQTGDGLSVQDALSIQKYLAQIIKSLPEFGLSEPA